MSEGLELNEEALKCVVESMREMRLYKPEDDVGSVTKAFLLDADGDLSVLSTAKHVVIEFNLEAEGKVMDYTYGILLSETLYAMPVQAVKIHNSPQKSLKTGLEPLKSPDDVEGAAVVFCMQSCGLPEDEETQSAGDTFLGELEAEVESKPEEDQEKLKPETNAKMAAFIEKWHQGEVAKLAEKMPGVVKLMAAMKASKSIETVYIRVFGENGCNCIPWEGMVMPMLGKVISYWAFHPTLQSLDVSQSNLGGFGSAVLAAMLLKNEKLARFDTTNSYKPRMGLTRGVFEGDSLKELKAKLPEQLEESGLDELMAMVVPPQ